MFLLELPSQLVDAIDEPQNPFFLGLVFSLSPYIP
jgi:hypothetical protein